MPLASRVVITALAALVIGFLVVRTTGVYFIMVTLAFAQMLYSFFTTPIWAAAQTGFTSPCGPN